MRPLRAFLTRLTAIFSRSRSACDLSAELDAHLQAHIDDNVQAGMTRGEARPCAPSD